MPTLPKLRLLHVTEGLGPEHGGPGIDLPHYCRALAEIGNSVVLATVWSSESDHAACQMQCDVGGASEMVSESLQGNNFFVMSFRSQGLTKWRFSFGLYTWLHRNLRSFDLVHLHSLYSFPVLAAAYLSQGEKRPYVITPHGVLAAVQRSVSRKKKATYNALLGNRILNRASAIVFSAEAEREDASPLAIRAPATLIRNGIALNQFSHLPPRGGFRNKYLAGHDGSLVLYLGRLNSKKGLDLLIPAFKQVLRDHPSARLAIVGAGYPPTYATLVASWVKEQGIQNQVVLTGLISGELKLAAFADSDVFVLPSRAENFATAMFEAMACHLPVVISSGVNLCSEVSKAGSGIVVEFEVGQLASALSTLLGDASKRKIMGEKGRKLSENYTCNKTAAQLDLLYRHILAGNHPMAWGN